ncbi:hypothetical protein M8J76_016696 [Diaphorina citri]|nr:hypothetical protein M8J76_016696 [Diaphorina citri]
MDHAELIAEMAHIEHMSTQERLELARRRRIQQWKNWVQRERERSKHSKSNKNNVNHGSKPKRHIYFSDNVMLLEAASRNDIQEVRRLLVKGVSPDSTNEDGLTALHQCCIDNNEEMMKLLIEFKANVNAEDSEKWTPLHAAATCGHLPLVKYLIQHGANLLAVNADGNMPYDICEAEAALDHIEAEMAARGVTQALIDETRAAPETRMLEDLAAEAARGQDLEYKDPASGATPLHIAAANGYLRVVEYLLDQHHVDKDGWQPVHAAACWGHVDILEILVQNGADLNAKTKHDETPADICEDPELRERILALKSEQESKKMAEATRRRVKRTQSNNTRAQSVRRTSIRDKVLITKKDTLEEARLRLQAANNSLDLSNDSSRHHTSTTVINANSTGTLNNSKYSSLNKLTARYEPDGMAAVTNANTELTKAQSPSDPLSPPSPSLLSTVRSMSPATSSPSLSSSRPVVDLPTETSYSTEDNGKINIHVSVTINAGTLAELKKQRAQSRTGSLCAGSQLSPESLGGASPLSSPSNTEEDQVIGDAKAGQCCRLM